MYVCMLKSHGNVHPFPPPPLSLLPLSLPSLQGGHVDCLQWLVEEGRVPLQVRDAGGETLMHHAAYHGQVTTVLSFISGLIPKLFVSHSILL